MQSETCFCGNCQETTTNYAGQNIHDSHWLEELGDMFEAAVEGIKKVQTLSACFYDRMTGV